jgi:hypothetical protein
MGEHRKELVFTTLDEEKLFCPRRSEPGGSLVMRALKGVLV